MRLCKKTARKEIVIWRQLQQMFREEGRVEGRVEALHSSMINILMLRFGQLPYGLEHDIRCCAGVLDTAVLQELTS